MTSVIPVTSATFVMPAAPVVLVILAAHEVPEALAGVSSGGHIIGLIMAEMIKV
ncbi:hypothetical protein ACIBCT_27215 [Streptosporangium sp. NPDC050855]|uniref:hypothetical protein n=1 Tax=Streptosporangium sp. NPDC050855 TaxID=3366194 RepID=UPI0037986C4E